MQKPRKCIEASEAESILRDLCIAGDVVFSSAELKDDVLDFSLYLIEHEVYLSLRYEISWGFYNLALTDVDKSMFITSNSKVSPYDAKDDLKAKLNRFRFVTNVIDTK